MNITASAVAPTVADPERSARFLEQTFDFEREMTAEGFVSLTRPDLGFNVIYLRAGLPTFKPRDRAARTADGILIVLVVRRHRRRVRAAHRRWEARSSRRSRPRSGASVTSRSRTRTVSSCNSCSGSPLHPKRSPPSCRGTTRRLAGPAPPRRAWIDLLHRSDDIRGFSLAAARIPCSRLKRSTVQRECSPRERRDSREASQDSLRPSTLAWVARRGDSASRAQCRPFA